jgi:hypothetical protein
MRFTIQKCTTTSRQQLSLERIYDYSQEKKPKWKTQSFLLRVASYAKSILWQHRSLSSDYKSDICESNYALFHSNRAPIPALLLSLSPSTNSNFPLQNYKISFNFLYAGLFSTFPAFFKSKNKAENHKNN